MGLQLADTGTGIFSVRFLSVLENVNTKDYEEVGILLTVTDSTGTVIKSTRHTIHTVYTSVNAGGVIKTATELGGKYVAAVKLVNIPANLGVLNFNVETYVITSRSTGKVPLVLDRASVSFNGSTLIV